MKALSPRELSVLRLIADGKSNKEVGDQLGIAEKTVEKHRQNLYVKFGPGPHNAPGIVIKAMRMGIIV